MIVFIFADYPIFDLLLHDFYQRHRPVYLDLIFLLFNNMTSLLIKHNFRRNHNLEFVISDASFFLLKN